MRSESMWLEVSASIKPLWRAADAKDSICLRSNSAAWADMALGGLIGSVIFGIFGSYDMAWLISIAASLGGMVCLFRIEPLSRLLIPNWEASLPPRPAYPHRAAAPEQGGLHLCGPLFRLFCWFVHTHHTHG